MVKFNWAKLPMLTINITYEVSGEVIAENLGMALLTRAVVEMPGYSVDCM